MRNLSIVRNFEPVLLVAIDATKPRLAAVVVSVPISIEVEKVLLFGQQLDWELEVVSILLSVQHLTDL